MDMARSGISIRAQAQSVVAAFFQRPTPLYLLSSLLRFGLLLYGLFQDVHSPVKYTDVDYVVFTDAARFLAHGRSPYARETYRYTPLLAWLMLPTGWTSGHAVVDAALFQLGKVLFAAADLLTGWLLERVLWQHDGMRPARARMFAAVWLLNPMVATISTRGSSEGLLGVLTAALVWAVLARRTMLAGLLLGLGVHFKIYPFIWAPTVVWWMDDVRIGLGERSKGRFAFTAFLNRDRVRLGAVSLAVFTLLNVLMYVTYGMPFLTHTYFHHLSRLDHRHNFSPYHVPLYLASTSSGHPGGWRVESVAFVPQLLLSCLLIPLVAAKKDLATSMLAQTFAFVTFNKVCTSQYFLWYMVFLPLYLPRSSFLRHRRLGITALALWLVTQALWLHQAYQLEFLGRSTFVPGLWRSSLAFFLANCWILGIIIGDVEKRGPAMW